MKTKLTKFQILIIVVAVSVFLSQLAINSYYEWNAPANKLADKKKSDIDDFLNSELYRMRADADSVANREFSNSIAELRERNKRELDAKGKLKHVQSIEALTDSIKLTNNLRIAWVQTKVDSISSRYAKAESFWLNRVGGVGLIFVFEFLAVMFGFISSRRQKEYCILGKTFKLEFWVAITASFFAQIASCIVTQKGLNLFVGDAALAWFYAIAFIVLVPLYYWIGGMDIEEYGKPSMAIAPNKPEAITKVTERKESIEFSKTHKIEETQKEVPAKPASPDEAIDLYAQKKISAENGWSQRRIANIYFGGKLTEVNNRIKRREIELAKFEIV